MAARGWKIMVALFALGVGLTACSDTPANDFEAGECTNDSLTGSISEIDTVDCDDEHTAEAFAQFDLEGGDDDFPGAQEASTQGDERCQGELFEDYVGIEYAASKYIASNIAPSEDSWSNGDRTVICLIVGATDGPLEGSAEGTEE